MSLPPVECIYVTEDLLRQWKNMGNPTLRPSNPVPMIRFLYELCWFMVREELAFHKCKAVLESVEFLEKVSPEELGSNFADIVAQMAQDVDEREREKSNLLKEEMDAGAASKRRKLKRDHLPSVEAGEYSLAAPPPPPLAIGLSQSYDGRERGDRKTAMVQRTAYLEEPGLRMHAKEAASKMTRREAEQMHDREWDDEKRQRAEPKRRRRK